ncbi:hypothetical protein A9974_13410 [Achromobacter sp. UMC71]|nr:hypothetical protein [Achromobacter sp. UMC71]
MLAIRVLLRLAKLEVFARQAASQCKIAAPGYSGPLSHQIMAEGLRRPPEISVTVRIARSDGSEKSTSMSNASHLKLSFTTSTRRLRVIPPQKR